MVYTVNDGINPAVQATLSVTVVAAGQPGDVKKQRESSTEVEINGSVGYNVLPDYYSTTGDDLYLTGATATTAGEGDTVDFTPAGQITFHDKGSSGTGNHEVLFSITDGNVVRAGKLTVNVKADGDTQPIASAVVSQSLVNVPITVKPLDSVLSPSVEPLLLVNVAPKGAASKAIAARLSPSCLNSRLRPSPCASSRGWSSRCRRTCDRGASGRCRTTCARSSARWRSGASSRAVPARPRTTSPIHSVRISTPPASVTPANGPSQQNSWHVTNSTAANSS